MVEVSQSYDMQLYLPTIYAFEKSRAPSRPLAVQIVLLLMAGESESAKRGRKLH